MSGVHFEVLDLDFVFSVRVLFLRVTESEHSGFCVRSLEFNDCAQNVELRQMRFNKGPAVHRASVKFRI